jgi:hypothetical protein
MSGSRWSGFAITDIVFARYVTHLEMLVEDVIPRHVIHRDETTLGVVNLGDDMAPDY